MNFSEYENLILIANCERRRVGFFIFPLSFTFVRKSGIYNPWPIFRIVTWMKDAVPAKARIKMGYQAKGVAK